VGTFFGECERRRTAYACARSCNDSYFTGQSPRDCRCLGGGWLQLSHGEPPLLDRNDSPVTLMLISPIGTSGLVALRHEFTGRMQGSKLAELTAVLTRLD
jgi:hypothetical protein